MTQATMPYLDQAACLGHTTIMDGFNRDNVMHGLDLCSRCPEFVKCETWINSLSNHQKRDILTGVMAGRVWGEAKRHLTASERKQHGGIIPKSDRAWINDGR